MFDFFFLSSIQARNQNFFRAGGAGFVESGHFDKYFINKHKERKAPQGKFGSFFS